MFVYRLVFLPITDRLEDRFDDLIFGDGADDLSFYKEVRAASPKRYAEVCAGGLARPVHRAAHQRHVEVFIKLGGFDGGFDLVDNRKKVSCQPSACGACDDVDTWPAKAQRLQDLVPDFDFVNALRGQRDADRVSDAVGEQ